ncbi:Uncharacterised protein g10006 [Pycnogonum litorale]
MPLLSRCCWFHNIRDGSLAIAMFYFGSDVMGIPFFGVLLGLTEHVADAFTSHGYPVLRVEDIKRNAYIWLGILPFHLIFTLIMLHGIIRKIRVLLIPWIIVDAARILYSATQVVMDVITVTDPPMITLCVNGLLFVGLQGYFNVCIISQYQALKDEERNRKIECVKSKKYYHKYDGVQMDVNDCAL